VPGSVPNVASVTVASFGGVFDLPETGKALPHGCVTILIELGSGSLSVAELRTRMIVVGLQHQPTSFEQAGSIDCVEIRIAPSIAVRLGMDLPALQNGVFTLDSVFGSDADRLANRLSAVDTIDRGVVVNELLRSKMSHVRPTPVVETLEHLERGNVSLGVSGVVADLGGSRSAVWRQTNGALGMGPQRYLMLRRFEHAVNLLNAGLPIAQVASTAGYADQSHLHREIVRLTQASPGNLVSDLGATFVQDIGVASRTN
jgi:AraC-like DNA-binding protein